MAPKNIKKQLQSLEINLVRKDVGFYEQLVGLVSKKQSSGIIIFGIMPYISLFTIESNKYIKSNLNYCTTSLPKNNEKIIQNSRMRLKLFDDDKNKVDGTFNLLDDISQFLEDWFINSHQGPLASMKQALQPDMGIFFYEDHIIGSTHTWTYTNSLEKIEQLNSFEDTAGRMSQIAKSVGQDLGSYLAGIKKLRDFHSIPKNKLDYEIDDSQFSYQDVKSDKFFSLSFDKNAKKSINFSLFLFLSIANFTNCVILKTIPKKLLYNSFKIKFITLFHLASSLKQLQNYCYLELSDDSKEFFKQVLKDKDLKIIQSKKELRNILVHYKIETTSESHFPSDPNFKNLVEHFFDRDYTFGEIDEKISYQINRIASILEEWSNWSLDSHPHSKCF